jgi:hypothetical protein
MKITIAGLADVCLFGLAVACRLAAVWLLQSHLVVRSTYEHGEIAANLVAGRGFSTHFLGATGPTSQQAPVYPAMLAVDYFLCGVETPRALLLMECGQCLLGGLMALGVRRLSRLALPDCPWIAWSAALVVAVYPTLVYAATHIQVVTLATTFFVATLSAGYQTASSGRNRDAAITGALLALLALTDPILALSVLGVAWAICRSGLGEPGHTARSLRLVAIVAAVAVVGVAPWIVRNFAVHGEFVAIKSTFGYAFWQGNCKLSEGTDKVVRPSINEILERDQGRSGLGGLNRTLWEARHEAGYLDDIALTKADYRLLGSVSEPDRSRILWRRALSDIAADPARYVRLCLRRLRYFILFDETNPKSKVLAYRAPHLALTIFATLGLVFSAATVRSRLMPTIITAMAITIFHSLTIVSTRFHIPIEPLMAIWAGAGLDRTLASSRLKWARAAGSSMPALRLRWETLRATRARLDNLS